jgi:uncharacterized protein (DUF2336 family)
MSASESLISELEDAIRTGPPDKRAATLRRVTDLFVVRAPRLRGEQVALFDAVIVNLIEDIEIKALVELGGRVAEMINAPPDVIRRLASHDDITVSGPVLTLSQRLTDADLVDTVQTKSQAHLLAVSGRLRINEPVTDALVRHGDTAVMRKVAANSGARFSEHGFDTLVERARSDEVLAENVAQRSDVPPHLLQALVLRASATVLERLLAVTRPDAHAEIARILAKVSAEVTSEAAGTVDNATLGALRSMHDAGELGERDLTEFAKSGRFDETIAALALMSGMPVEVVASLMQEDRVDPVIVMCKAAGLSWPSTWAVVGARRNGRGGVALDSGAVQEDFNKLSRATAERAIRFWRVRQQGAHGPMTPSDAGRRSA